jgi:H+/K+-exchanging ATPase alpha polypeptide
MKGAPERILNRCTKILVNGEEVEFTDEMRTQVEDANTKFGGMGERVLAFAKLELDPSVYTKSPPYPFEVKKWKEW